MKLSNIKTVLALSVGSVAVIMIAACSGSVASIEPEANTSPVTVASGALEAKEVVFTMDAAEQEVPPPSIEAGTLVKGSSTNIYYVTDTGTCRLIPDHETFAAFGFSPQEVIVVDDDLLSAMPEGDVLTRLLYDEDNNLHWVANGKLWRVNEWKGTVQASSHPKLATSRLNESLQAKLPIHYGLNGVLIRRGQTVFYNMNRTITLVTSDNLDGVEIVDILPEMLGLYPRQQQLEMAWTKLNSLTQAANVRSGPGLNFEIIDTIDKNDRILVRGRAEDSNWLQINYRGQDAWLAGDLIKDQHLVELFRPVSFEPVVSKEVEPQQNSSIQCSTTVQPAAVVIPSCHAQPIRGFGTVWQNHPEVRPLLGCPFTNFRRNEHATRAAVQTFERGWMLWLETDTVANVDPIYVFFDDNDSYIRYGDRELIDAHSYAPTPQGFYKVGDRFAKVYWEEIGPKGRQRLGFATNEARDSQGAFQEFQNGRMFWAGEADTIYVIYQGSFDFDGDGIFTWSQGWEKLRRHL